MGAQDAAGQSGGTAIDPEPKPATRSRRDGYDKEDAFQCETASFLTSALPKPGAWFCHIPNAGKRSARTGAHYKRQGLVPGSPDIVIFHAGQAYCIELKARYGTLSDSQRIVIPEIEAAGVPVAVCRTLDEVELALIAWGIPLRQTLEQFRAPRLSIQAGWKAALQERMTAANFVRLARANRGRRAKS